MKVLTGQRKKLYKRVIKLSRGLYKNNFPEIFRKKDRITIPLDFGLDCTSCSSYNTVEELLHERGYEIHNYVEGYATKSGDKNIYKIGKIIKDNNYVLTKFKDSIYRQKLKLVLSRHPYDIACASWGQDWDSCLNIENGVCRDEVFSMLIANSLLIAYLVSANGNKVLGRIFIIPYYNFDSGDYWLYPAGTAYGIFSEEIRQYLKRWLDNNFNEKYVVPNLLTNELRVDFHFPEYLVYNNEDRKKITYYNMNNINNIAIRKHLNELTLESTLKDFYNDTNKYPNLDVIRYEVNKWYRYHESYGRSKDDRDMKRNRFLLYWLNDTQPEVNECGDYLNYITRFKFKINRSLNIEDYLTNHNLSDKNLIKYVKSLKAAIKWDDGKEMLKLANGYTQKLLLEKFL